MQIVDYIAMLKESFTVGFVWEDSSIGTMWERGGNRSAGYTTASNSQQKLVQRGARVIWARHFNFPNINQDHFHVKGVEFMSSTAFRASI